MSLSPEQKAAVARWVAAGESLSEIQRRLAGEFSIQLTYMEVRFLVDDLGISMPPPPPRPAGTPDAGNGKAAPAARAPEKKGLLSKLKDAVSGAAPEAGEAVDMPEKAMDEDYPEELPEGAASVHMSIDKVTLIPGALASGTVTFSDGVTGKWIVDNYGRPGFTEISKPGYRPSQADAESFMRELSHQLQSRGF